MGRRREFDVDDALCRAAEAFRCAGFEALNVRDLSKSMGISPSSLYETWGNKKELYRATLRVYADAIVAHFVGRLRDQPDPVAAIRRALYDSVGAAATDPKQCGCLVPNAAAELAPVDESVKFIVASTYARIEDAFHGALCDAGLSRSKAELRDIARMLVATIQGIRIIGKTGATREDLESIADGAMLALGEGGRC